MFREILWLSFSSLYTFWSCQVFYFLILFKFFQIMYSTKWFLFLFFSFLSIIINSSLLHFVKMFRCWWIADFEWNFLTLITCLINLAFFFLFIQAWKRKMRIKCCLPSTQCNCNFSPKTYNPEDFSLHNFSMLFRRKSRDGEEKKRHIHLKWIDKLCNCNYSLYRYFDFSSTWLLMMNF